MKHIFILPKKILFVLLVTVLVVSMFPSPGNNTRAASALQSEELPACSGEIDVETGELISNDLQVLFIIDDSGSMGRTNGNDTIGARFAGVENAVDVLGEVYLKALETLADKSGVAPEDLSTEARESLPKINLAAIHFANEIDLNTGWVQIAPQNRESWEISTRTNINVQLISDAIRDIRYLNSRTTDFRKPFQEAASLFETIEKPDPEGRPRRFVIVLTDGAPDEGNGELHRKANSAELLIAHFAVVRASVTRFDTNLIYVLAFNNGPDQSYWLKTKDYWSDRIALEATRIQDVIENGEVVVDQLSILRDVVSS